MVVFIYNRDTFFNLIKDQGKSICAFYPFKLFLWDYIKYIIVVVGRQRHCTQQQHRQFWSSHHRQYASPQHLDMTIFLPETLKTLKFY